MVRTVVTPRLTLAGAAKRTLLTSSDLTNLTLTCASVEPEGDPGHDHYQTAGDVDLDHVVTHRPEVTVWNTPGTRVRSCFLPYVTKTVLGAF